MKIWEGEMSIVVVLCMTDEADEDSVTVMAVLRSDDD